MMAWLARYLGHTDAETEKRVKQAMKDNERASADLRQALETIDNRTAANQ